MWKNGGGGGGVVHTNLSVSERVGIMSRTASNMNPPLMDGSVVSFSPSCAI